MFVWKKGQNIIVDAVRLMNEMLPDKQGKDKTGKKAGNMILLELVSLSVCNAEHELQLHLYYKDIYT